jgi:hypothetical protein
MQGDQEKRLGLPISPYMDRSSKAQGRMSINFIDFIVQPYYQKLAILLPELQFINEILKQNKTQWQVVEAEDTALSAAAAAAAASTPTHASSHASHAPGAVAAAASGGAGAAGPAPDPAAAAPAAVAAAPSASATPSE